MEVQTIENTLTGYELERRRNILLNYEFIKSCGLPIKPLINVKTESLDYDDDYYMDSIDDTLCSPGENIAEMSSEGVEVKNGPPAMFNQQSQNNQNLCSVSGTMQYKHLIERDKAKATETNKGAIEDTQRSAKGNNQNNITVDRNRKICSFYKRGKLEISTSAVSLRCVDCCKEKDFQMCHTDHSSVDFAEAETSNSISKSLSNGIFPSSEEGTDANHSECSANSQLIQVEEAMDDENAALERNGGMSLQNEQETELSLSSNAEVYVCDNKSNHQQAITQVEGELNGSLAAKFGMEYTETQIPDNDNQLLSCGEDRNFSHGDRSTNEPVIEAEDANGNATLKKEGETSLLNGSETELSLLPSPDVNVCSQDKTEPEITRMNQEDDYEITETDRYPTAKFKGTCTEYLLPDHHYCLPPGKMSRDSRGIQCSMTNTFCSVEDFVVRDNVMLGTISCKESRDSNHSGSLVEESIVLENFIDDYKNESGPRASLEKGFVIEESVTHAELTVCADDTTAPVFRKTTEDVSENSENRESNVLRNDSSCNAEALVEDKNSRETKRCKNRGRHFEASVFSSHLNCCRSRNKSIDMVDDITIQGNGELKTRESNITGRPKSIKDWLCNVCGKRLSARASLERHQQIHAREKANTCDKCGKHFHKKSYLRKHKQAHAERMPYFCGICGIGFKRLDNLESHQQNHRGVELYECDVCYKRFSVSGHLKEHKKIHTVERPYQCNVCGKRFKQKSGLKVHMRFHTGEKPNGCEICGKRFVSSSDLKRHRRIHTGEKPFECRFCGKRFNDSSALNVHERTHSVKKLGEYRNKRLGLEKQQEMPSEELSCSRKGFCQLSGPTGNQESHAKKSQYQCVTWPVCIERDQEMSSEGSQSNVKGFYQLCDLGQQQSHAKESLNKCDVQLDKRLKMSLEQSILSQNNGKGFNPLSGLTGQQQSHAKENLNKCDVQLDKRPKMSLEQSILSQNNGKGFNPLSGPTGQQQSHAKESLNESDVQRKHPKMSPEQSIMSQNHGKGFNQLSGLTGQQQSHAKENLNKCDVQLDKRPKMSLEQSILSQNNREGFNQQSGLTGQQQSHAKESLNESDAQLKHPKMPPEQSILNLYNGKGFYQLSDLTQQQQSHAKESVYGHHMLSEEDSCSDSAQGLRQPEEDLRSHQRSRTKESKCKCDICGKIFRRPSSLKVHKRVHKDEKPYACGICGKGFNKSMSLRKHQQTHGKRGSYKCDICGRGFFEPLNLDKHKEIHSGKRRFICDICGYGFNISSHLTAHRRIHTKEKPFPCTICEKRFITASALKKHEIIHSGEKPFVCDVCERRFNQRGSLKRHRKIHAKEG